MMKTTATTPDEYVECLGGWQRDTVERLRKAVRTDRRLEEALKWGHLVYLFEGPVLLIRAEETRVLFGFWRGKRLLEIESRLVPSGKYEMATVELREGDSVTTTTAKKLAKAAADLNGELGDPRDAAKPVKKAKTAKKTKLAKNTKVAKKAKTTTKAQSAKKVTATKKANR
ncbi:MAG: DUF1801 domain-containing protein [Candidatus Eisenbacteria bacterium]|uniref:DUF1801 domain-containing protein n=1 Tax=Eiseniibacteriota bacterium TaxID=2212470 RepID=A0A956NFT5_UNCEI|nr:DUF1801 domain-containing protein [Candidatus Eisenbacteria bacterium]